MNEWMCTGICVLDGQPCRSQINDEFEPVFPGFISMTIVKGSMGGD